MKHNVNDLRAAMFEAMDLLKTGQITVEQARAMSELGKVMIDSAKTEVEYIKINGGGELPFLETDERLPEGVVSVTRHRIK